MIDWFFDKDVDHIAMFAIDSMAMIRGPTATCTYRDEVGQNSGIEIRDKFKLATKGDLRMTKVGHIITERTDRVITVYCKKMFFKLGKKRKWNIPMHVRVTEDDVIATYCPLCDRFVEVREQLIDYQWTGGILNGTSWSSIRENCC